MSKIESNSVLILGFIKDNLLSSSKEIYDGINAELGYATVKRVLQKLISENFIITIGQGRGTRYTLSQGYTLLYPVSMEEYFKKETDERSINASFNFSLITDLLAKVSLFTDDETARLNELQEIFKNNISKLSEPEYKKELDHLAIDLSWKSSQIEGNTYSLLETERLLKEQKTADGKTRDEATMLLNHKAALDFIIENPTYVQPLTVSVIEDIHSILIKELDINRNIRQHRVSVSGTNYRPLDNEYQIRDALNDMCITVNRTENIFEKALLVLALISYIQPFADGNKRTARIISNAILVHNQYCPISFRTVDSLDYKKAMLVFYEQNNISAVKRIFIEQFEFAVGAYF